MEPVFTRAFLLLIGGQFLQNLAFATLPLVPLLLAMQGASRSEIGFVMAIAGVGGVLFRPLVGWALDTLGRRIVLYIATAAAALTVATVGVAGGVGWPLYVNRFVFGIALGALATAYFTMATDHAPRSRRTEALALFGVAGLLGLVINPVASALGIEGEALVWFFPVVGGIVLLSLLPVLAMPRGGEPSSPSSAPQGSAPAWRALVTPSILPVWWVSVAFAAMLSAVLFFSVVVAENRGLERPADLWFTYALGAVVVRLAGARLPDRLGAHNVIAPALACYALGCLVFATAATPQSFLMGGLLAGLGHGYAFPVLVSAALGRAPDHLRGSTIAAFTALLEMAGFCMSPILGWVADTYDDAVMFGLAAVVGCAGLAVWALWEHKAQRRAP